MNEEQRKGLMRYSVHQAVLARPEHTASSPCLLTHLPFPPTLQPRQHLGRKLQEELNVQWKFLTNSQHPVMIISLLFSSLTL